MKSVQMRGFFWSAFPCIRTGYGDKLRKSPYSVQIQENTDKKLRIWTLFTQWKINLVWKKNKTITFLKISFWEISFCLFIIKQNKKCLLSLNFGMEICKTVSRSIAGNQAQKSCTIITLNMFCFQSLQYSSIYIFLSLFEELGGVVGH